MRTLALLVCVVVIAFVGACVSPAGPGVGGVTLGVTLSHLMDQLQQAIETAKNAGLNIEIEAGREVAIAIANAQNAYKDSLNLTLKGVDQTTRNTVDRLQAMVQQVESHTVSDLKDLTTSAQQIVNSLPFRNHQPQLSAQAPRFIVPSANAYPIALRFSGNFEFAARRGYAPRFEVRGHKYPPSENSTQRLVFEIPVTDLFEPGELTKYMTVTGTLSVPWKEDGFLGLTHYDRVDAYNIILGALPASPGKLQLTRTVQEPKRREQGFETNEYYQTSASDGANDDHKDVPYAVSPDSGWRVVKGSSGFNERWSEGDWSKTFKSDDGDRVQWNVTTIHHGLGTAGRVRFTITFKEYQEYEEPASKTEPVEIRWGDTRSFEYPTGTWKLVFDAFDGTHAEFTGASLANAFLKVSNEGGALKIGTADPKTLVWP